MTRTKQIAIWLGLWAYWVFVSRNNHPTLLLDCLAAGLLVAAFAAAVYFNWCVLVPRFWGRRQFGAYWLSLLLSVGVLAVADAAAIRAVYDAIWGPDPHRFSFGVNCVLEFTGICVHLLAAAGLLRFLWRRQRGANRT